MIYEVRAKFITDRKSEFMARLASGNIRGQQPDGEEIHAAMQRAVIGDDGYVIWSEVCYCASPLRHERETVYDSYFTDMTTARIDQHREYEGRSFMDYLAG